MPVAGYLHVEEVSEVPGRFVRHDHLAPPVLNTPVRVPEAGLGGLGGVAALKDGVCRVSEAVTGEKNPSWWQGGCGGGPECGGGADVEDRGSVFFLLSQLK